VLSAYHGSSGDNYTNTVFDDSSTVLISSGSAPFTGTFKPDNTQGVFNGQNLHGNWVLKVNDNAGGDTGRVENYCLLMQYTALLGITQNDVPRVFALNQNYPNPFNPMTVISYSVPKQVFVSIKVYDVLGREVMTAVSEIKKAGNYNVTVDGSKLASGVYFYRIEAGDFVNAKKMVLIK
jgi:hypothetical protein